MQQLREKDTNKFLSLFPMTNVHLNNVRPQLSSVFSFLTKGGRSRRRAGEVVSFWDACKYKRLTPDESVKKFKKTVERTAHYYLSKSRGLEQDDLISAGYEGLLRGVKDYDPSKVKYKLSSFSAYIFNCIRWGILNEIAQFGSAEESEVFTKQHEIPVKVRLREGSRGRTVKRTVAAKKVVERSFCEFVSLDESRDDYDSLHETIPCPSSVSPDKQVLIEEVWELVDNLPLQQQKVVNLRYKDGKTLEQAGKVLGVTKERVRQIEKKALDALRALLV
jgi:RNA polymerase sigma factor (sigma-70 family)